MEILHYLFLRLSWKIGPSAPTQEIHTRADERQSHIATWDILSFTVEK